MGAMSRMIEVRYFAAARAAAGGVAHEAVPLPAGADTLTRAQLVDLLVSLHPEPPAGEPPLERVLAQSSILLDGVVLMDSSDAPAHASAVRPGVRIDVLPPFAGG